MNIYDGVLKFKGTWRTYQKRILDRSDKYLSDKKIHIVAAPGSGKTTLGIELIRRQGSPCLILSPSITIREQWIGRIKEGSLCPHQDYVYFNWPTKEEEQAVEDYTKRAKEIVRELKENGEFVKVIASHRGLLIQRITANNFLIIQNTSFHFLFF